MCRLLPHTCLSGGPSGRCAVGRCCLCVLKVWSVGRAPTRCSCLTFPPATFGLKTACPTESRVKWIQWILSVVLNRPRSGGHGSRVWTGTVFSRGDVPSVALGSQAWAGSQALPRWPTHQKESRCPSGDNVSSHCSQLLPIRPIFVTRVVSLSGQFSHVHANFSPRGRERWTDELS